MNKEIFYRNVLRGLQESPSFGGFDRSPMTSLAHTLHEATLANTPCKRLSLSSTLSDTPQSNIETELNVSDENSEVSSLGTGEKSPFTPISIESSPQNKENIHTPYYSPSFTQINRHQQSPLRELQNTGTRNLATRNLSFSPLKKPVSPSLREHLSPIKNPTPPDDCDSNSRDSGYSESGQKRDGFCLPRPIAPTRKLNLDMSPPISPPFKSPPVSRRSARSFASLKKKSISDEDGFFMELIEGSEDTILEEGQDCSKSSLATLLSAPIQLSYAAEPSPCSSGPRLPIRRCLSMIDSSTPLSSRVKQINTDVTCPNNGASPTLTAPSFKRPQSPSDSSLALNAKRRRAEHQLESLSVIKPSLENKSGTSKTVTMLHHSSNPESASKGVQRPKLSRCHSESHVSIMKALNISSSHTGDLTGDFSQTLSLPIISGGKHPDLNSISIDTLATLIRGSFADKVASFKVIDCRYPYEFNGGHITNSVNWHHPSMVAEFLEEHKEPPKKSTANSPRNILIFHCEFSAERGPRAQRMLRETDRTVNKEHYPALHFPELYLLEGGYKAFYEAYPKLCSPVDYIKMLDENHSEDFKFFRSKSKSWAAENKQSRCPVARTGPKRLGL